MYGRRQRGRKKRLKGDDSMILGALYNFRPKILLENTYLLVILRLKRSPSLRIRSAYSLSTASTYFPQTRRVDQTK